MLRVVSTSVTGPIVHFIILGFQSVEGLSTSLTGTGPGPRPDFSFIRNVIKSNILSIVQHYPCPVVARSYDFKIKRL